MTLLDYVETKSLYRGLDYYERKMVCTIKKRAPGIFDSVVSGSGDNNYNIHIELQDHRKCTCSCPYAAGTHILCKHIAATVFTILPGCNRQS